MKKKQFYAAIILLFLLINISSKRLSAQDCTYSEASVKIDFGTNNNPKDVNLSGLKNYRKVSSICPNDGEYAFVNYTFDCFVGKWHTLADDHTAGDASGRFMLVNASERPSTFFINYIAGLIPGKKYRLSFWVANICATTDGCNPTPPIIKTSLLNGNKEIVNFTTGAIATTAKAIWHEYYGEFTMPIDAATIMLKMEDITDGGCGNDFALDDIEFKECKIKEVAAVEAPKKIVEEKKPITKPTVVDKQVAPAKPVIVKPVTPIKPTVVKQPTTIVKPLPKPAIKEAVTIIKAEKPLPTPKVIATRENALARKIVTEESELVIELYDNGEIDGDTITVYHNNQLIVNHVGLSLKPIVMKIKVDKANPHHEIIMVADNLGSIPPNTSLMIVTANKKRYEIFISSSEQKNAKVIIDLQ
jgi:hypothetical protein